MRVPSVVALGVGLAACHSVHRLAPAAEGELARATHRDGTLVYRGHVTAPGEPGSPLFHYERRVVDVAEGVRSSHVTFTPEGEPVVLHEADHSPEYGLIAFRAIQGQTGAVGSVHVAEDGRSVYRCDRGGRVRRRVETAGDPLQVGPTVVGYIRTHWTTLMEDRPVAIRFVQMARCRSYGFTLRRVPGDGPRIRIELKPRSTLVSLGVPRIELVFDSDGSLQAYSGPVPPRRTAGRRLRPLTGQVDYEPISEAYR